MPTPPPYTLFVEPSRRRATVTLAGSVDGADLEEALHALLEHRAWRPGVDVLVDGRGITELCVSPDQMYALAAAGRAAVDGLGQGRTALVARREMDYAIGRLYVCLTRGTERERRAFRSLDHALAWLGLEPAGAVHVVDVYVSEAAPEEPAAQIALTPARPIPAP